MKETQKTTFTTERDGIKVSVVLEYPGSTPTTEVTKLRSAIKELLDYVADNGQTELLLTKKQVVNMTGLTIRADKPMKKGNGLYSFGLSGKVSIESQSSLYNLTQTNTKPDIMIVWSTQKKEPKKGKAGDKVPTKTAPEGKPQA